MSLQARLRHALGERWVALPERGVDQPLVVGHAGSADVQVPSAALGQRHCVLFVHEGRWVVQDVGGAGGIFVNGSKVDSAGFLSVGDVITLGSGDTAPSLEIDPVGVAEGRGGQPAFASPPPANASPAEPLPTALYTPASQATPAYVAPPYVTPPQTAYPNGYPVYPGGYPVPASAAPTQWTQHPAPAAVPDGSLVDWPTDATPRHYTSRRRRAPDGSSGLFVGMMLTLFITAGVGYWVYRHFGRPVPVVQAPGPSTQITQSPTLTRAPGRDPSGTLPTIFDPAAVAPQTTRAITTRPAARVAAVPDSGATLPDPGDSSGDMGGDTPAQPIESTPPEVSAEAVPATVEDPAWKQVEAARFLKDEAKAILQFDDYSRTRPGLNADKVGQYTETMLDRIWLERVENLCEQRDDLNRKIQEAEKELAEETDAAYKKRVLVPLREQYVIRLGNVEAELTKNMKYDGKSAPNLLDDSETEKLRQARDPQYYMSWKDRVLTHIRRTHGELPWVATKSR